MFNGTRPVSGEQSGGRIRTRGAASPAGFAAEKKLAEQRDEFRPGPEYIAKWGYKVDADETAIYLP
jgi:hypothetical protein